MSFLRVFHENQIVILFWKIQFKNVGVQIVTNLQIESIFNQCIGLSFCDPFVYDYFRWSEIIAHAVLYKLTMNYVNVL